MKTNDQIVDPRSGRLRPDIPAQMVQRMTLRLRMKAEEIAMERAFGPLFLCVATSPCVALSSRGKNPAQSAAGTASERAQ